MGCGSSLDASSVHEQTQNVNTLMPWQQLNGVPPPQQTTNIVQQFVQLDVRIAKLESTCPGARMATVEAWIEHLQGKLNALMGIEGLEYAFSKQLLIKQQQQQQQQQQLQQPLNTQLPIGVIGETADVLQLNYESNGGVGGGGGLEAFAIASSQQQQQQQQQQRQQQQQQQQKQNGIAGLLPNGYAMANGAAQRYANHNGHLPNGNVINNTNNTNINNNNNSNNNNGNNSSSNSSNMRRNSKTLMTNTPNQDLANLALNLGIVGDVQKASTHEDFFANLSDSALHLTAIRYYTEIVEHNKVRLKTLTDAYAQLNELYVNCDGIIAFISGGTYMSRQEENLDGQLETARDVRDKLGSTLEQWRICGTLLQTAATAATQALQLWQRLAKTINPKDKIQLALACRNSLQASIISLECAQMSLPHVELKHLSNRQMLAVQHSNRYMITDIANLSRYEHSLKVFSVYESNVAKASMWLHDTFQNSLRKDFVKADETVNNLAKMLRDHREEIFKAARRQ